MNRQQIIEYMLNEFGAEDEHLWMSFPDYAVFRNKRNKKWFALLSAVERSKLSLEGEGKVEILNLRCDSILLGSLLHNEGYFPAYHMSKKNWVTVLLDEKTDSEELKDLIHLSYEIIDKSK